MTKETSILEELYHSPPKSSEYLKLHYSEGTEPGFTRIKKNKKFIYLNNGKEIKEESVVHRINKLRIPPAWTDVWISPKAKSHLQATGMDVKGRKQYIYHAKWNEFRNLLKFYKLVIVGNSLNKIQAQVEKHLKEDGLTKNKILACIVKVIEESYIRIGNEQYVKENQSYGITTLRKKHTNVEKNKVIFDFKGKSNIEHHIEIKDKRISNIVNKLLNIPGLEVFKYEDESGNVIDIKSNDVNDYLKEISNENITAKDFRTWAGTILCFEELQSYDTNLNKKEIKKALACVFEHVAFKLGNTKAVSRDYYIHPQLISTFQNKKFQKEVEEIQKDFPKEDATEQLLLEFLKRFVMEELKDIVEIDN